MATSLLALLDDIAAVLDDVALLTKLAAKKTATDWRAVALTPLVVNALVGLAAGAVVLAGWSRISEWLQPR